MATIPKDVYEYLANFADDKTIVKMLSVNKKFNDPIFFQRIFSRRYPLLVQFKKNENWREFYLDMVRYISLLKEKYDFPYIPEQTFNPKEFFKFAAEVGKNSIWPSGLSYAARSGKKDLVDFIIRKHLETGKDSDLINSRYLYDLVLMSASKAGVIEMVKYAIEKGARRFDLALYDAIESRNYDTVKFLLEKVNIDSIHIKNLIRRVADTGEVKILELLLSDPRINSSRDFINSINESLVIDAEYNDLEIVKILLSYPEITAEFINRAIMRTAKNGNLEVLKLLISDNRADFDREDVIRLAKKFGKLEIEEFLSEK